MELMKYSSHWLRNLRMPWRLGLSLTLFQTRHSFESCATTTKRTTQQVHIAICYSFFSRIKWSLPCSLPLPPREIMAYEDKSYMFEHHEDLLDMRLISLRRWRDTPQRSFFRLYEAFCAGYEEYIG